MFHVYFYTQDRKICAGKKDAKHCLETKVTIEGAVRDELTTLEVGFQLPLSVTASAKACDVSCKNPDSQTKLSMSKLKLH